MIKIVKRFDELTNRELYQILQMRMEAFIVEQKGCYQDLDDIDYDAIHIFYMDNNSMLGCIRVFEKKDEENCAQFGRLVVKTRNQGLGKQLMKDAEIIAKDYFHATHIYLTGRKSAFGFYEKCHYDLIEECSFETTGYGIFRKVI